MSVNNVSLSNEDFVLFYGFKSLPFVFVEAFFFLTISPAMFILAI